MGREDPRCFHQGVCKCGILPEAELGRGGKESGERWVIERKNLIASPLTSSLKTLLGWEEEKWRY